MAETRDDDAPIQPYDKPAGGWDALKSSWQALRQQDAVLRGPGTLLRTNQPTGFDCPGCAWPDRNPHSTFEFCENGVKAVANEATSKRVTAAFFGEGAVAEGAFHESMNLAALWKLPVAFFCENNLYAMGTALERSESQTDLCAKAAAFRVPTLEADGMDAVAVHEAAAQAVSHVRRGEGPFFVEFRTYRYRSHSMFDPDLYRDRAEVEAWKHRGPIHNLSNRLKGEGRLTEEQFGAIDAAAQREVDEAVAFAEAGTWEPVEDLSRDVHTGAAP